MLTTRSSYPDGRNVVRRGQLTLKAGVTTVRVLGDGYYALRYREDLVRWDVVSPCPRSGLHANGRAGYVTGGIRPVPVSLTVWDRNCFGVQRLRAESPTTIHV